MFKAVLKWCAKLLLGDYGIYHIYRWQGSAGHPDLASGLRVVEMSSAEVASCGDAVLAEQHGYAGDEAVAFGALEGDRLLGVCFYWVGKRYQQRGFWPLAARQAKLVQLFTAPAARGHGIARQLVAHSAQQMCARGWRTLFARVWHSNVPSWRAFERAGWSRVALVIEINPLRRQEPTRLRLQPLSRGDR